MDGGAIPIPTRERAEAIEGTSPGNVLLFFQSAKEDIVKEIGKKFTALHKDLGEKIDAIGVSVLDKVSSGDRRNSNIGHGASGRSRSSSEKKRKGPPPSERMQCLATVLEKDKTPFVLQWSMIVTLLSFAQMNPSLMTWVPGAARDHLARHMDVIDTASGISTLFFSVESDQKWSLFHGTIGKLWSTVLRCSISSSILSVRRTCFDGSDSTMSIPPWLVSFGSKQNTYATVSEIVKCLETTDEMARTSGNLALLTRRKRMRVEGEKPADDFEAERDYCVSQMRSSMLRSWSYGRAEARKVLTGEVLFLVEKIRGYSSVDEAKADGYEIMFCAPSPDEGTVPHVLQGTLWDIPLAATRDGTDEELWATNSELLQKLAQRFPSLHVTLRYKRAILHLGTDAGGGAVPPFWAAHEQVSLHKLAMNVLTASLSVKSSKIVLQTSALSLRAIHVLSIGIRGLLRQSLNLGLTAMEKWALGGLTCDELGKDDGEKVPVITSSRQGKGSSTVIQNAKDEKLTMSVASYREEFEKSRIVAMSQGASSRSEAGQAAYCVDADLEEECLDGAN